MAETAGVQEYLESMYRLARERSDRTVSTSALAGNMAVSAASASEMLKRLAGLGLVEHRPYAGARLTVKGAREAARVIRYHRLWERFMVDLLGMDWDEVHAEACRFEHVTTPAIADRLSQLLNNPATCPHGNPLPADETDLLMTTADDATGATDAAATQRGSPEPLASFDDGPSRHLRLIDAPLGCSGTIRSISEDPELLRYCMSQDLLPGAEFVVVATHPIEELVEVEIHNLPVSIRSRAARIKIAAPRRLMVGPRVGANVIVSCAEPAAGDSQVASTAQTTAGGDAR